MKERIRDEEKVRQCILQGRFEEAYTVLKDVEFKVVDNFLSRIGFDTGSLTIYAFICYMIRCSKCVDYHFIAQSIMCGALDHLEGAYETGLHHNLEILKAEPEHLDAMTMMLFYNTTPEKPVTNEEADNYVNKILQIDPNNETVKHFLKFHRRT